MHQSLTFGLLVLCTCAAALVAVQSHRLSEVLRIPAPAFFLLGSAAVATWVPQVTRPDPQTVERVVTLALVVILFDGGLHIGAARFRSTARTIAALGVVGTFLTVAGAAVLVHQVLGISWYLAVLVATAVSPTDPAVVFSVLGRKEVEGGSGTVLEGESGANDPVGIALMASLLAAGGLSSGAVGHVAATFVLQMVVGTAVGVVGAWFLLQLMRRFALPSEGLYPVRTLVSAGLVFGLATVAHGSGFLAVFVAGILLGDERAPYKREIERFHSALASLGELVAFASLGLTVDLGVLGRGDVWGPGLAIGGLLALVIRPLLNAPLLLGSGLDRGERAFVLAAGLKGAVPLLLGSMLLPGDRGEQLYGVVVVVVLVSVLLQGTLVPVMARLLGVRMRQVEQEPFSIGIRMRAAPRGVQRHTVEGGSVADGLRLSQVPGLAEGTWVSLLLRGQALVPLRGDTVLLAGDEVLVQLDDEQDPEVVHGLFRSSTDLG